MPLSFPSQSHGTVAFGFFNIESDLLLLENLFFFADDFCRTVGRMAAAGSSGSFACPGFVIENVREVGDLTGAIHGVHFSGFIGEVYTLFPFPQDPGAFKQNPEGYQTRGQITAVIEKWAEHATIPLVCRRDESVAIGPFVFGASGFRDLIRYVWQGGYPRWKNEDRPSYVAKMKQNIQEGTNPLFDGVFEQKP